MMNRKYQLLIGTKLNKGKYVIKSLIRSSSMSNVYLIEDVPSLNRKMIVKEFFYASWEYEKEIVLEIGRHYPEFDWYIDDFVENNISYFVMQYIEGMTLEKSLSSSEENNLWRYNRVIKTSILLVKFVSKLHKYHIVHGDISPDNIIITKKGELYLIDYGNSLVSKGTCFSYKDGYSAPELRNNKDSIIDYRCDIYSIGATMHFMERKKTAESYIDRKIYRNDYRRIIQKCIKSNPNHRYYSTRSLYFRLILCRYRKCLLIIWVLISTLIVFLSGINKPFSIKKMDSNPENNFYYVIDNAKVTIIGSEASVTDITIPAEIEGYPVNSIQGLSKNVTKVIISEGIECIEAYAFENCQYLNEIFIPTSIEYIDKYAFVNCGQLENIRISSQNKFYIMENNQLVDKRNGDIVKKIGE